jgi:glycosyltransferase involved in cell wall biosynthesis
MTAERPTPRVVIAAPVFNKAEYLEEAARSILDQTYGDFALLLIDDGSSDGTVELCQALARQDPRVEVHVNPERLGMLGNTRRAFSLARERFPAAEFWALASDHDIWRPTWLERLVALLDAHPRAVLAYPQTQRIDERGRPYDAERAAWRSDTRGIGDPRARLAAAFNGMVAGDMIYGLFRAEVLDALGDVYRPVLVPDRLLLSELALRGEFVQAPEVLWLRRFRGLADLDRQRRAFFPDGVPAHARLPWWLQHVGALVLAYVVRPPRASGLSRRRGARLALTYLRLALRLRFRRRLRRRLARPRRVLRKHRRALRARGLRFRHHYAPRRVSGRAQMRLVLRLGPVLAPLLRRASHALRAVPLAGAPAARRLVPYADRLDAAILLQSEHAARRAARRAAVRARADRRRRARSAAHRQ